MSNKRGGIRERFKKAAVWDIYKKRQNAEGDAFWHAKKRNVYLREPMNIWRIYQNIVIIEPKRSSEAATY